MKPKYNLSELSLKVKITHTTNVNEAGQKASRRLKRFAKPGFWKLVDLTVFQGLLLLLVTFDIMLERHEDEAVILPFTSNFFVNLTFHSEIQGCVIGDMKQWLNRQPWHSPFKVIIRHNFGNTVKISRKASFKREYSKKLSITKSNAKFCYFCIKKRKRNSFIW